MARVFRYNQDNLLGGLSNTPELNKNYSEVKDAKNVLFNLSRGVERRNPTRLSNFFNIKSAESAGSLLDAYRAPYLYNPDFDFMKEFTYNGKKSVLVILDLNERQRQNKTSISPHNGIIGRFTPTITISQSISFHMFSNFAMEYSQYDMDIFGLKYIPVIYDKESGDILFSIFDYLNYEYKGDGNIDRDLYVKSKLSRYNVRKENEYPDGREHLYLDKVFADNYFNRFVELFKVSSDLKAKDLFRLQVNNKGSLIIMNRAKKIKIDKIFGDVSLDVFSRARNFTRSNAIPVIGDPQDKTSSFLYDGLLHHSLSEFIYIKSTDFNTKYELNFTFSHFKSSDNYTQLHDYSFKVEHLTERPEWVDETNNLVAADVVNVEKITEIIAEKIIDALVLETDFGTEQYQVVYDAKKGVIEIKRGFIFIKRFYEYISNILDSNDTDLKTRFYKQYYNFTSKESLLVNDFMMQYKKFIPTDYIADYTCLRSGIVNNDVIIDVHRKSGGLFKGATYTYTPVVDDSKNISIDDSRDQFLIIKPAYVSQFELAKREFIGSDSNDYNNVKNSIGGSIDDITRIDSDIFPDGYQVRVDMDIKTDEVDNENVIYYIKDKNSFKECAYILYHYEYLQELDYFNSTSGSFQLNTAVISFNEDNNLIDTYFNNRVSNYFGRGVINESNKTGYVLYNREYPDFIEYSKNQPVLINFNKDDVQFKDINDIQFKENRIMFVYENDILFSRINKISDFYRSSTITNNPADPIHISYLNGNGSTFKFVVPFRHNLLIFTDNDYQISLTIDGVVALENMRFFDFSNFQYQKDIEPKNINNRLYFVSKSKNNNSTLYNIFENENGVLTTKTLNDKIMGLDFEYKDFYVYGEYLIIQSKENEKEFLINRTGHNYDGEKAYDIWTKIEMPYDFTFNIYDDDFIYFIHKNGSINEMFIGEYMDSQKPILYVDRMIKNKHVNAIRGFNNDSSLYSFNDEIIGGTQDIDYNNELWIYSNENEMDIYINDGYDNTVDAKDIFMMIDGVQYPVKSIERIPAKFFNEIFNNSFRGFYGKLLIKIEINDNPELLESLEPENATVINDIIEYFNYYSQTPYNIEITSGIEYESYINLNRFYITDRFSQQKITYGKTNILEVGFLFGDTNSFKVDVNTKRRPDPRTSMYQARVKLNDLYNNTEYGHYEKLDNSLFNVKIKSSNNDYNVKLYNNSAAGFTIKSLIYKVDFENKR